MPIQITCSHCARQQKAPDDAAGRTTPCPACGHSVAVPTPPPVAPALADRFGPMTPPLEPALVTLAGRRVNFVGVAATAFGGLGLTVAWIPLIGLLAIPLAGVALILGIAGLILATTRGSGWISPTMGLILAVAAGLVAGPRVGAALPKVKATDPEGKTVKLGEVGEGSLASAAWTRRSLPTR